VIEAYRPYLPVSATTPVISLLEGNTPLIHSQALSKRVGTGVRVFVKYEGVNPTGSFKDRGMTVAISKAVEAGSVAVLCASTGNTSASASAYAARAGLRSIVLIPGGKIALGKLSQALIHKAAVVAVDANFDRCLKLAQAMVEAYPITLVNSLNPYRIEGQKTCAFEVCDVLGHAPDFNVTPVGNAGNITAQWKGYREYRERGCIDKTPVMLGFQAKGADPIVQGCIIENPETVATAIRIGNPASWKEAVAAAQQSGGLIDSVNDEQILEAYRLLAQEDGIFVEPASAASVAGLLYLAEQGYFQGPLRARGGLDIVCIVTGHGLKDPERALKSVPAVESVAPQLEAIAKAAGVA
jgi:threonine synthase